MTDFNQRGNLTWWQSDTMLEGINYPNTVNLTLNLGKNSFSIKIIWFLNRLFFV
jgi:laminin gamma 1